MNPTHAAYLRNFDTHSNAQPIWALARSYSILTEAFDRTVCTGPIVNGAIQPQNCSEIGKISRFARDLTHEYVAPRLQHMERSLSDFRKACVRYEGSWEYRIDMVRITDLGPFMALAGR